MGCDPGAFFIVQSGSILLELQFDQGAEAGAGEDAPPPGGPRRTFYYEAGGIVGDTEFFLDRRRTFCARATGPSCVWALTREALAAMTRDSPETAVLLLGIVLRSACLNVTHAYEVLDRLG